MEKLSEKQLRQIEELFRFELKGIGGFAEADKTSVPMKIYNRKMKVLSLADLIKTKKASGKAKDILVLPELEALRELLSETEEV